MFTFFIAKIMGNKSKWGFSALNHHRIVALASIKKMNVAYYQIFQETFLRLDLFI